MKTSELEGDALTWAVCVAEDTYMDVDDIKSGYWSYSTNWAQGGPIIERELISVRKEPFDGDFVAHCCFKVATQRGDS